MIRAKKSLGQNFLRSKSALSKIVEAAEIKKGDTVLEIGPGEGALTERLLEAGAHVVAIEKDSRLIPILSETFANTLETNGLTLIEGDILDFDPADMLRYGNGYKLVANIPYYITGAILEKFLESSHRPERIVLLVQKEVAERIVARDGKESILSLSVKAFGTPKLETKVPAGAFHPKPSVDSAILSIRSISGAPFEDERSVRQYFKVVRAGFAHKRKFLSKNLEAVASPEAVGRAFETLSIPTNVRAEDLDVLTWIKLAREL